MTFQVRNLLMYCLVQFLGSVSFIAFLLVVFFRFFVFDFVELIQRYVRIVGSDKGQVSLMLLTPDGLNSYFSKVNQRRPVSNRNCVIFQR